MYGPMGAGLPVLPRGMRWKSKLVTSTGTFDPAVECPNAYGFLRIVWGGGGGGGGNATQGGGGHGQIFDTISVIEVSGRITATIGAGGTAAPSGTGGTGGDTTLSWTNVDGTTMSLHAYGAVNQYTYAMGFGNASVMAGGNPWFASTRGCMARVNAVGTRLPSNFAVTGGEGIFTFVDTLAGGYPCSQLPTNTNEGAGGWRGRGGLNNGTTPPTGYSAGGGTNAAGAAQAGKGGFAEFFWMEPIQ